MRFSLAATCKAARAMKVTLMIADFARVANGKHKFRLELLDADGQGVPIPNGESVRAEGEFEAGRPAGLRPGTPVDAPLVVPFGPLVLDEGRYELRLTINDETKEDWFIAFTVRHAAAQAD